MSANRARPACLVRSRRPPVGPAPGRVAAAALCLAVLAAAPARADFFDDARQTFTADIPHFFQDDIPCAFGGRPTSHTRTACPDEEKKARERARANAPARAGTPAQAAPNGAAPAQRGTR